MFSSLDRVDIVLEPDADGRQQFVQTDHRSATEIEQEPELSALFALVRVLNAKRMAESDSPEPVVLYVTQERPPVFLRRVIHAAGGRLVVGAGRPPEAEEGLALSLDEVIESCFARLARSVANEYNVPQTVQGLEALESKLAVLAGDPEDDEFGYWSAVLKLGTFGGEIIRATNGGEWIVGNSGSLPLALATKFRGEPATVNPLGKAIKRFANGEEDSLAWFVNVVCSPQ